MKVLRNSLIWLIVASLGVVCAYVNGSNFTNTDIAITVATILGLALTAVGTMIGIYSIIKAHEVASRKAELAEREFNQKTAREIYDNLLVPLQEVMSDIQNLGDFLIENAKYSRENSNFEIPPHYPQQLDSDINAFNAKLNMLILYVTMDEYQEQFKTAHQLSKSVEYIIDSYNKRTWKKETTANLVEARKVADKLHVELIAVIGKLK